MCKKHNSLARLSITHSHVIVKAKKYLLYKEKWSGYMESNSKSRRNNPLFMRNKYQTDGKYGIPIIKKQDIPLDDISLIACSDTRSHASVENCKSGVHFFVDDYRFENIYRHPEKSLNKYSQYAFLLTPDYSTYADMDTWRQIESVAHSRWVGAYWQEHGLKVIPTITWSTPSSYEYCFDGVEKQSIVAIGMIGCKKNKFGFMNGYNEMLRRIKPKAIICFGKPFEEMEGNIIAVDYLKSRKVVR